MNNKQNSSKYLITGLHDIAICDHSWFEELGPYRSREIRYVVNYKKNCVFVYLVARHELGCVHFGTMIPQNIDGYYNIVSNSKNYEFIKKQWWFQDVRKAMTNYSPAKTK